MITVEAIRRKYPHPVKFSYKYASHTTKYCVGGACIKYAKITLPAPADYYEHVFPTVVSLAWALRQLNPALSEFQSATLAGKILDWNDAEHFNLAWDTMEYALTYSPSF